MTDSTDSELVRLYAHDHDDKAFTKLVRRHLSLVYHVALRKSGGNHQLAEEVGQRVFTLLARKASALTGHATLVGWLHKATCFATSEALRTERRRIAREQRAFAMEQIDRENSTSQTNLNWNALGPVIDGALSELKDRDRDIVLLRYFAGLAHAEVGTRLQLSENAARMRLDRALEKLHGILKQRGITSTTAALSLTLASQASASSVVIPAGVTSSISATALAGTAVATQAGFMTLMITAKSTLWLAGGLAILSLSFTGYTAFQRNANDQRLVDARESEQQLRNEARSLESNLKKIDADISSTRLEVSTALPKKEKASDDSATPGSFDVETARLKEFIDKRQSQLAANPDYQRRWNAATTAAFDLEYQPYFQAASMSGDKVSKFEAILMKKAWATNDLRAAARTLGLPDQDPTIKAEANRQESAFNEELASLLSADELRALREFDQTSMPRRLINEVAANTYYTSTPLTADQGLRLKRLLEANDPHLTNTGPAWRQDGIDWSTILQKSEPILTPEQQTVLQAVAARSRWIGERIRILNGWTNP